MKKALSVFLLALMVLSAAACSPAPKAPAEKPITACVGSEPNTLDPTLNNAVDGAIYVIHAFEGLTKTDKDGKTVAGVAKDWTMNADGTEFVFNIRDDAKWSDGKPVVAADFVYSWQRAVDPNTAADYAYQLYYVKNAQAINTTDPAKTPITQDLLNTLGVQAVSDKQLKVTLEAPCAYFLEITAFPTLYPLRKDIVASNPQWTMKPETYIGNGPYVMKSRTPSEKIVFVKNENYYAKDTIVAKEIDFILMNDQNAMLAAYKNGDLLFSDDMPTTEIPALLKSGDAIIAPNLGTYFYCFNTTKPPFNNVKVREALTLAIDREYLVNEITKANQIPAGAFVPDGIPDAAAGSQFRKVGKDYYDPKTAGYAANVEKAKQLLKDAGYKDMSKFPTIELKYNTSEGHKKIAEYVASEWKKNLGINVTLQNEEWNVFQDSRSSGNYMVARHGWLGDYVDPMTFLDMWTSTSGQNDAKWKNTDFDKLIDTAKKSGDPQVRMTAMHQAEDLLMKDKPIMPIYYYTDPELISPKLKGVVSSPLGFKYFMWATIEK